MLIDWFTVVAQALNFLVLVWLLRRYLYQPILHAIDEREKRIAAELESAADLQSQAQRERDVFQRKNEEFDRQQAARLSSATAEVQTQRKRMLEEARTAAETLRATQQELLLSENLSLQAEIRRRTQEQVFGVARKTLADLSDVSLEEQMCRTFLRQLHELDQNAKQELRQGLTPESTSQALVRSAFTLTAAQRALIQQALNELLSVELPVRFTTGPEVICGVELILNGRLVAWSVRDYIESLRETISADGSSVTEKADETF